MTMSPSDRTRFDAMRAEKQYALDCLHAAKGEIERLLALLKLATDAWESGSEDACSIACMDIAKSVGNEQDGDAHGQ